MDQRKKFSIREFIIRLGSWCERHPKIYLDRKMPAGNQNDKISTMPPVQFRCLVEMTKNGKLDRVV